MRSNGVISMYALSMLGRLGPDLEAMPRVRTELKDRVGRSPGAFLWHDLLV